MLALLATMAAATTTGGMGVESAVLGVTERAAEEQRGRPAVSVGVGGDGDGPSSEIHGAAGRGSRRELPSIRSLRGKVPATTWHTIKIRSVPAACSLQEARRGASPAYRRGEGLLSDVNGAAPASGVGGTVSALRHLQRLGRLRRVYCGLASGLQRVSAARRLRLGVSGGASAARRLQVDICG